MAMTNPNTDDRPTFSLLNLEIALAEPPPANPTEARLSDIHGFQYELTSSPWSHDVLELAMAAATSLPLSERDETALLWLIIVGVPSSDKTWTVQLLKDDPGCYWVDSVTENFLASGYRSATGERAPSMLAALDQKCFAVKDLTTIFSLRAEKVTKFLGDLQAIYDREYVKLTGTVGAVGGKAAFTMLACVTPEALANHQHYMSQIGSRFGFYRTPRLTDRERDEGLDRTLNTGRKPKMEALRALVREHLAEVRRAPVELEPESPKVREATKTLADLLARGRGIVRHDPGTRQIEGTQIEEPFRAHQMLLTLVRALARVHGRTVVTGHEIELARRVVLSTIPVDRGEVLGLLPECPEGFTAKVCAPRIGKGEPRAKELLDELVAVGLLTQERGVSAGGRPPTHYRPIDRFAELVTRPVVPMVHLPGW
jgi:hypothetical protein